ncbi:MAG: 30S ribosomal protein S6 [Microgenomates group bacterium]|jgi:small subunit ribosomal protein S6
MNKYALTIVTKPELDEKARKELLDSVTKKMGEAVKEELWGIRDLSYPIQKLTKGYYAHYFFEVSPATIDPLDKFIKLEEDIIRYLIVRIK